MRGVEAALERIVGRAAGAEGPGAILGVSVPGLGVDWQGAAGRFARDSSRALAPDDGFRIASVPTPQHRYGLGVSIRRHGAPGRPETTRSLWGHGGHWGSWMFYVPDWRSTIAGTVNRSGLDNRWIADAIVACVEEAT